MWGGVLGKKHLRVKIAFSNPLHWRCRDIKDIAPKQKTVKVKKVGEKQ